MVSPRDVSYFKTIYLTINLNVIMLIFKVFLLKIENNLGSHHY